MFLYRRFYDIWILEVIQLITPNQGIWKILPLGIRFWKFRSDFEITWVAAICVGVLFSKSMCRSYCAGHFDIRFDFTSTDAIFTPVISIFDRFFIQNHFSPAAPCDDIGIQRCVNFIFMKSLSGNVHLCARPRKNLKMDFLCLVPREWVRVRYRFQWFLKLYNLSYWAPSFIRWIQKSRNSA